MSDRVRDLIRLRDRMRGAAAVWAGNSADVGDFTYATSPRIWTWGEGARLRVGKFCSIGGGVQFLLGGEHRTEWATTYPFNVLLPDAEWTDEHVAATKGNIVIGNDVWIGNDVTILSGVHIADGVVIGNGAVVTRDIYESYAVYGGVPARRIRLRPCAWHVHRLAWWDWPVEKIAEALPLLQSENYEGLIRFDEGWKHE